MAVTRVAFALRPLRAVPTLLLLLLLLLLTLLAVPHIIALSGSDISSSSSSVSISSVSGSQASSSSSSSPSDRILSPEYYRSVYKNIDQKQQQQYQRQQIPITGTTSTENGAAADIDVDIDIDNDDARKKGGMTPWDIGNNRPQPAIVRAYEEGKIRGNVLDAGCGVGENCVYLANKYGIESITGFDLSEDAVQIATDTVNKSVEEQEELSPFWTKPRFIAASCTEVADRHGPELISGTIHDDNNNNDNKNSDGSLFDVVIDSGLLHCLSNEDAKEYVQQISKLLRPNTGRFYIGCFSTANSDPWDNPRRISEDYLRNELFSCSEKWEVVSCKDCWWARPPSRGSSTGGAFSLALWVEIRCLALDQEEDDGIL